MFSSAFQVLWFLLKTLASTQWMILSSNYIYVVFRHSRENEFLLQLLSLWLIYWCHLKWIALFSLYLHPGNLGASQSKVLEPLKAENILIPVIGIFLSASAVFAVYHLWVHTSAVLRNGLNPLRLTEIYFFIFFLDLYNVHSDNDFLMMFRSVAGLKFFLGLGVLLVFPLFIFSKGVI